MLNSNLRCLSVIVSSVVISVSSVTWASEPIAPGTSSVDVTLQADGTLVGRLLNADGRPIDGAVVVLSQQENVLARTTTDADGVYRFSDRSPGVYRITAGRTTAEFRVWPAKAAPPGAKAFATIVENTVVIRGQLGENGLVTLGSLGIGTTGLVLGAIALDKANDAEDDAAAAQSLLKSISP